MYQRPAIRPTSPYTFSEIADRLEAYFHLNDDGVWPPRCAAASDQTAAVCRYGPHNGAVGCAVGILLTEEDAKFLDGYRETMSVYRIRSDHPDIYKVYFTDGFDLADALSKAQNTHDSPYDDSERNKVMMRAVVAELRRL